MHVRLRPCEPRDTQALTDLTSQLGYPVSEADLSERLTALLADPEDHQLRVAVDGRDRAIGWVHVERLRLLELPPAAQVMGLVVDDGHRSGGVGAALLEGAETIARGWGCQTMLIRSNVVRSRAHEFYERHGYMRVKTAYAFEKRLA
jgi:GNAT superfamily N-acetyltransferase